MSKLEIASFDNLMEYSQQTIKFAQMFGEQNSCELISNVASEIELVRTDDSFVVTNTNTLDGNSYVSSLYSAFVEYPKEELDLIKDAKAKLFASVALNSVGVIFRWLKIDDMVFLGNFLFSTNFYPDSFYTNANKILPSLIKKYPTKYICVRSLEKERYADMINLLKNDGWIIVPARIVYLFDFASLAERSKKNHYKNDMKLLSRTALECVSCGFADEDFVTMKKLFEALYIEKHSHQNPKFSAKFMQKACECGLLEIYAYRQNGAIVAFIAILQMQDVVSTPMLGYDTSLPSELGLYRLLCAKLHSLASERGLDINFSSGAGEFKKLRGARAQIEYTAIYAKHLTLYKQIILRTIAKITEGQMEKFFTQNNLV